MIRVRGSVFLCLLLAGCSGPAPKGETTARADEPSVPIDKIEEIEGWIRLKSVSSASAQQVKIESGPKEVRVTSGANSFAIPAARYRLNPKDDYAEIELGAKLQAMTAPTTVGPAIYDKMTLPVRQTEKCSGKTTINVPVWHGCGPIACDGSGEIIGVGCGGWTATNAPKP
jgi:hypothetical protein